MVEALAPKEAIPPVRTGEKREMVELPDGNKRLPFVAMVVEPVEPKAALPPVRYVAKRFVPVALVKVSPPLKFKSVLVALFENGYAKAS